MYIINPRLLKAVAVAMSKDETRYYLCGVSFTVKDNWAVLRATDGHRLIIARQPCAGDNCDVIIPRTLIDKIKLNRKAAPELTVTITGGTVLLEYAGETFGGALINGMFPNTSRLVQGVKSDIGEAAQFNPDYLADFKKAAEIMQYESPIPNVYHNGNGPALVRIGSQEDIFGIIMPYRTGQDLQSVPSIAWAC
jgi:DNA polymerase III sliding clamp (beta) subunit (PCNA family)